MAGTYSAVALAGMLVLGLVVGGVVAYGALRTSSTPGTITYTTTVESTVTQTISSSSSSATTSSSSSSGPDLAQISAALSNTENASLTYSSYNFAKGSLDVWLVNNGTSAIMLTPQMCLFNGTFIQGTFFAVLDPSVIQYGIYYYMPPNSTVIVEISPTANLFAGYNSTLTVLNNVFTFTYGTYKD